MLHLILLMARTITIFKLTISAKEVELVGLPGEVLEEVLLDVIGI